jgi:hypothetical protein
MAILMTERLAPSTAGTLGHQTDEPLPAVITGRSSLPDLRSVDIAALGEV